MLEESTDRPVIVLFRNDLRLADNPALHAAAESGKPVVPVVIEETVGAPPFRAKGAAFRWWRHHSLRALERSLGGMGAGLVIRSGEQATILGDLVERSGADLVVWNRRYDPAGRITDQETRSVLDERSVTVQDYPASLLHDPQTVQTISGGPYKVYTPFFRKLMSSIGAVRPLPLPNELRPHTKPIESLALDRLCLLPTGPDWSEPLADAWQPGEDAALERLDEWTGGAVGGYDVDRERPDRPGTSTLSARLAHGELSPRQVWAALGTAEAEASAPEGDIHAFRRQIVFREFAWHVLAHHPDLAVSNYNRQFDGFAWQTGEAALRAWQKGQTGYPIVDASMRQLWQTGWMHNRMRMIAASFLTKHLRIDWREGERWFHDTLVDHDEALNAFNWQWVAGSGADASPYFRVFNPITQGRKFDPDGAYVRRYVPELTGLGRKFIHEPWATPAEELRKADIQLGADYSVPIVDHATARQDALDAYKAMRNAA